MKITFLLLFLFSLQYTFSQTKNVEQHSKHAPIWVKNNYKRLSNYLTHKYDNDSLKVRAIYIWITNNIKYDVKLKHKDFKSNKILRRGKGICGNYARLFEDLCKDANIEVIPVEGYSKGGGYFPEHKYYWNNHVWNLVKIKGQWELMDLTWGSGYTIMKKPFLAEVLSRIFRKPYLYKSKFVQEQNDDFYCVNPSLLVFTHLPAVQEMQMLPRPISIDVFEKNQPHIDSVVQQSINMYHDTTSTNYALLEKIKTKDPVERNLFLAPYVKTFNERNDEFTMKAHYEVSLKLKKERKEIDKEDYKSIHKKDEEILKHIKVVKKSAGNFKRDTYSSYKWNNKVNSNRHSKIYKSTTGKRGVFKRVRLQARKSYWNYSFSIMNARLSLLRNQLRYSTIPKSSLRGTLRPKEYKSTNRKITEKLFKQLENNKQKIKLLLTQTDVLKDSLVVYRAREKELHHQEIKNLYGLLGDICVRIRLNQLQEWMQKILPHFAHSDSLFSSYRETQKEEKTYRRTVILKSRKQKYANCKKAYRLASINLKLIKKIKKHSYYNQHEDSLFQSCKKTSWQIRQRFTEMNVDRLQDRIDFKSYKAEELEIANHLIKYYTYEIGVEKLRFKKRKQFLLNQYKNTRNYAKSRLDWASSDLQFYSRELLKLKRLIREKEREQKSLLLK